MGTIIGIVNTKGGVGKTTISNAIANEFARRKLKTLVIDYDSQASQTFLMGYNPKQYVGTEHDITNIFYEKPVMPLQVKENLYLIPSNNSLKKEAESGRIGKEHFLHNFLKGDEFEGKKGIADDFDIVIIDSEGGGGTLETSVEIASDYILIPIRPTLLDETGTLSTLETLVKNVKLFKLKNLTLLGFIAVDFDKRAKEPIERYADLKLSLPKILRQVSFLKTAVEPEDIFLPEIHRRTVWTKASASQMFIHDYIEQNETYSKDILLLLKEIGDEILKRIKFNPNLD